MPTRQQIAAAQRAQIDSAKTIPLEQLLPSLGFAWDKKKSNGGAWVRNADEVKVFKGRSGDSMWKSFDGDLSGKSAGNLVDLVMHVDRVDFRGACARIRELLGLTDPADDYDRAQSSKPTIPLAASSLVNSSEKEARKATPDELQRRYDDAAEVWRTGAPVPSYMQPRFFDRIPDLFSGTFGVERHRSSPRVVFTYYRYDDAGDLVMAGYERKGNKRDTKYSTGGQSGFWKSRPAATPDILFIAEAPLDAIAHALCSDDVAVARSRGRGIDYIALRSGAGAHVVEHIRRLSDQGLRRVFLITDNDPAGMGYAQEVMKGVEEAKKAGEIPNDLVCRYTAPTHWQEDWADVLAFLADHVKRDDMPPPPACSPSYAPA